MKLNKTKEKYVAFLRGINVGGRHKVSMEKLRSELEKLNLNKVVTILNSGNVIFEAIENDIEMLEKNISQHLETVFDFPIPTILRKSETITNLLYRNPFKDVIRTKDIKLYVSFLRKETSTVMQLPWTSNDKAFKIIGITDRTILSILDLSVSNTPKGMESLERLFGKDITTRNWNTIVRIADKMSNIH